ncbi:MAG: flagellar motor protein MotB [Acidobacteriota bacterium]|nr:flagellar motor protein MotB [Acidobacteriota bacterium]
MSGGRRGRRGHHEEEVENGERWLLTYADMITLLLALFIVLFAISTINQKKFLALALGLKESFDPKPGVLQSGNGLLNNASLTQTAGNSFKIAGVPGTTTTTTVPPGSTQNPSGNAQANATLQKLQAQIQAQLAAAGLTGNVSLQLETRGLVVQILADKVFFATGSADLGPKGSQVVDAVASVLKSYTFNVDVEGYTDNQPLVGGPYGSNEELSAVRAVNVVLRLENNDGINPARLSATGYGSSRPIVPNTSPQNMAENRRIDIVILTSQSAQP